MHKINLGNIKEWAANYTGPQFDGILCDPPYELGFMGKSWDSSGIAFDTEMWADLFRHIKPGGHLLAFSGSRTYHRMAVAIEDAGFEIRDMIEWVYGSGFPKSLNIGKAVDKIQGNEVASTYTPNDKNAVYGKNYGGGITDNTPADNEYNGYGTALKPAHEPCVLARKPIEGTVANNVLKHGTGGLNINGTRIGYNQEDAKKNNKGDTSQEHENAVWKDSNHKERRDVFVANGRFPANLIHDGSDEVEAVFPQTKAGVAVRRNKGIVASKNVTFNANDPTNTEDVGYGDSGSASRFFYTAKSSKSERNAGLEGFEDIKLDIGDDRPSGSFNERFGHNEPRPTKNAHPTVKPLSLTKYLATLIKPPTGGRLLVPFSGSGSEMIGALQAGWEYVEGVELTEEYIPIAEARIKYWLEQKAEEDNKPKQSSLI